MGLLFNSDKMGLTPEGAPMQMDELALLLSAMSGQNQGAGSGVANMMRNLYIRKLMKNRAAAREKFTNEAITGIGTPPAVANPAAASPAAGMGGAPPGNRFSLNAKAAASPGMFSPLLGGGPGGASTQSPFSAGVLGGIGQQMARRMIPSQNSQESSLVTQGGNTNRAAQFLAPTPQKIEAIKKMMGSGDELMRQTGQAWLTAAAASPTAKDRYLVVGNHLYDMWQNSWIQTPGESGIQVHHLDEGPNILEITDEDGTKRLQTVVVPKEGNWQIREVLGSYNSDTGEATNKLAIVNTDTGLARDVHDENGDTVLAGVNVQLQGEKATATSGAITEMWSKYTSAGESLALLGELKQELPTIVEALKYSGRVKLAWGDLMSKLGLDPGEEFKTMTTAVAKAQHVANLYIKAITGAQMSEREANRLLKAIPNPGDSPDRFASKLEAATRISQISYDYYTKMINKYGMTTQGMKRAREESWKYADSLVTQFEQENEREMGHGAGVTILPPE